MQCDVEKLHVPPYDRRGEYSRNPDYQDTTYTMYHYWTNDVRESENELLAIKSWERNIQTSSNAQNVPGYVYVICRN